MKLRGVSSGTHRRKEKKDGRGTKPCGSTWHEHGSWTATRSRTQDAGCIVGVLCIRARHFQPLENSPGVFSSHGNLRTLPFSHEHTVRLESAGNALGTGLAFRGTTAFFFAHRDREGFLPLEHPRPPRWKNVTRIRNNKQPIQTSTSNRNPNKPKETPHK